MTKPGTYQAKAGTLTEYIKVLLWGAGYPFGLFAFALTIIGTILLMVQR
jgi:hypothetical protein